MSASATQGSHNKSNEDVLFKDLSSKQQNRNTDADTSMFKLAQLLYCKLMKQTHYTEHTNYKCVIGLETKASR